MFKQFDYWSSGVVTDCRYKKIKMLFNFRLQFLIDGKHNTNVSVTNNNFGNPQ